VDESAVDNNNVFEDNSNFSDDGNDRSGLPDNEMTDNSQSDVNEINDEEKDDVTQDEGPDDNEQDDTDQIVLAGVSGLSVDATIDSIDLTWTNPTMEGFENVVVILNDSQSPQSTTDGTEVYNGIDETYSETTVEAGKYYYYAVFACYGDLGCSKPAYAYAQPCYTQLDVVFSIDVSTTMSDILSDLENEIGLVWDFVADNFPDETPHFGLSVFVDDYLLTNSGQPFASVLDIKTEFNNWYTHTSSNEQTQSTAANYDWPENSLDALAVSATDFNWRDSAETLRIIIHATDDTFLEKPDSFSSGIAVEHTYDETVALLVQEKIRVGAFAAKIGGSTGTTNVEPGFFTDYNSKSSIPVATGGEVYFIEDVKDGTIHMYDSVNTFIENVMCRSYDDK
jgi:hypothetical protein